MNQWYIKKPEGKVYGPVDWADLVVWAAEGRVGPDDVLSQDQQSWHSPASLPELGLQYEIPLDDESTYGPIHIQTLAELLVEGDVPVSTPVRHAETQEIREAARWVIPELVEHHHVDQSELSALKSQIDSLTERLEKAEAIAAQPAMPADSENLRDIPQEVRKWQKLHEAERDDHIQTKARSQKQIDELKADLYAAYSDRDRLLYRASQAEHLYRKSQTDEKQQRIVAGSSVQEPTQLEEAHEQLLANYERLLREVEQQHAEIARLQQTPQQPRADENQNRLNELQAQVERERGQRELAVSRSEELEATYAELLKSYRELNDRYIRLRNPDS